MLFRVAGGAPEGLEANKPWTRTVRASVPGLFALQQADRGLQKLTDSGGRYRRAVKPGRLAIAPKGQFRERMDGVGPSSDHHGHRSRLRAEARQQRLRAAKHIARGRHADGRELPRRRMRLRDVQGLLHGRAFRRPSGRTPGPTFGAAQGIRAAILSGVSFRSGPPPRRPCSISALHCNAPPQGAYPQCGPNCGRRGSRGSRGHVRRDSWPLPALLCEPASLRSTSRRAKATSSSGPDFGDRVPGGRC